MYQFIVIHSGYRTILIDDQHTIQLGASPPLLRVFPQVSAMLPRSRPAIGAALFLLASMAFLVLKRF